MELFQLTGEEVRSYDAAKLKETATAIRHELAKIRMDIYTARNQHTGKIRGFKKSLARLLTVTSANRNAAPKAPKAPKAAPVAKSPKAPKAAKAAVAKAPAKAPKAAAKAKTTKSK